MFSNRTVSGHSCLEANLLRTLHLETDLCSAVAWKKVGRKLEGKAKKKRHKVRGLNRCCVRGWAILIRLLGGDYGVYTALIHLAVRISHSDTETLPPINERTGTCLRNTCTWTTNWPDLTSNEANGKPAINLNGCWIKTLSRLFRSDWPSHHMIQKSYLKPNYIVLNVIY